MLKMLGLGWEDLQGEMVEKLGVDNVSMLDDAYESIEKWLHTPAGIFNAINDLVVQANERMKADQLYGEALNIGTIYLQNQLINKVPLVLLEKLLPASGGISSFIKTVYWLVRNGQDLLSVGTRLVGQAPNLTDPNKVNEVAGVVTDALKKVTVAMLDFAAVQMNLAKLPSDIGNALRGIRDKVQKRIQPLWTSVLDKGTKLRDKLINADPKANVAALTKGDLLGNIGNVQEVDLDGQKQKLWASYKNGKITIWLKNCSGEKQDLGELIAKWEKGATKDEEVALKNINTTYTATLQTLRPLEKVMQYYMPRIQAEKSQKEKAKLTSKYLQTIKGLDKGEKHLAQLNEHLKKFGAAAKACFAAGTPLLTPSGSKPIEDFVAGDEILSRDEYNPDGPVLVKIVEEVFERTGPVLNLHVAGQVIRTSGEHPFYVVGKDWTAANELQPGDLLVSHDGQQLPVEEVWETGEWETLYNLRVSDFHTYFVGAAEWGFSTWAHNTYDFVSGTKVAEDVKEKLTSQGKTLTDANRDKIIEFIAHPSEKPNLWYGRVADHDKLVTLLVTKLKSGPLPADKLQAALVAYFDQSCVAGVNGVAGATADGAQTALNKAVNGSKLPAGRSGSFDEVVLAVAEPGLPVKDQIEMGGWIAYIHSLGVKGTDPVTGSPLNNVDITGRTVRQVHDHWLTLPGYKNTIELHGHHIVFKKASVNARKDAQEAKDILLYFGINPYYDIENLAYAPNQGHPAHVMQKILAQMKLVLPKWKEMSAAGARKAIGIFLANIARDYVNKHSNLGY